MLWEGGNPQKGNSPLRERSLLIAHPVRARLGDGTRAEWKQLLGDAGLWAGVTCCPARLLGLALGTDGSGLGTARSEAPARFWTGLQHRVGMEQIMEGQFILPELSLMK